MKLRFLLYFSFGIALGLAYLIPYVNEPLNPCQHDNDFGRAWYGQRCIPYCPPDPKECD